MVKGMSVAVLAVALSGAGASSAAASDQSVRAAIRQFQPGLAQSALSLESALVAKPSTAAYATLDAATRRYLATLTIDHTVLAATRASTSKVASGRTLILASLTHLSQAASDLDRGLQAAKVHNRPAAARELAVSEKQFHRAAADEVAAAKLIGHV